MKYNRSFLTGLLACGFVLAMLSSAQAQTTKEGAAKVVRIKGSARYSTGGGVWQPLSVGDVLRPGTVIQSDREQGSYVDLVLGEGKVPSISGQVAGTTAPGGSTVAGSQAVGQQNTIRVFENTVLGVDKLTAVDTGADVVTDTQLDLRAGRIVGSVKKQSAASRYEIKLPNGVAGIRGTIYDISADGRIRVAQGTVVLSIVDSNGNVQTRVINAGNEFDPRTDQILPLSADVIKVIMSEVGSIHAAGTVFLTPINMNPDAVIIPEANDTGITEPISR
jgi:hypothetical protein